MSWPQPCRQLVRCAAHAPPQSRYIEALLDKAVERKREQDIRYERQLLREREAEDHLFGDKDVFVTAAYRRKLEEDKLWQAQQDKRYVCRMSGAAVVCVLVLWLSVWCCGVRPVHGISPCAHCSGSVRRLQTM